VVVCPDRIVRFTDALSYDELEEAVLSNSCQTISEGYDPAIFSPVVYRSCGNDTIDLQVVIKNLGTSMLTQASIALTGGANFGPYTWSGELDTYGSDTLRIEGIGLLNDDPIRIALTDDNVNNTNDSLQTQAALGYAQELVKLELALDNYPDEVSWEIRDDQDSVLYNGGGYEIPYEFISGVFALPAAGCYSFFLYDSNGDGLHGSQYGGFDGFCKFFSMYDSLSTHAELLYYDGSYNLSETPNTPAFLQFGFESGSSLGIPIKGTAWVNCYPNPADDVLHIARPGAQTFAELSITDVSGRLCHSRQLSGFDTSIDVNTADWDGGIYLVTLTTPESIQTVRVVVRAH